MFRALKEITFTPFIAFWRQHPALLYGLSLLIGFNIAFYGYTYLIIPIIGLWLPFLLFAFHHYSLRGLQPVLLSAILIIAAIEFEGARQLNPTLTEEGIVGTAIINIDSLQLKSSMFSKKWVYQCHLDSFIPDGSAKSIACSIKCSVMLPKNNRVLRPSADQSYRVRGTLLKTNKGITLLKVNSKDPWHPIAGSWGWAEWRYKAKQSVKRWIQSNVESHQIAVFLAGLATGEFDDRDLANDFSRFGLQHIMAISGFHFAIIAAILSFLLRLLMPYQISALLIVMLLSVYFLFLGISASILRAWVMITIAMFGCCLEKSPRALNSLGLALIITLLVDPHLSQTMGFQLSFLITAGILLFHSKADHMLTSLLAKRPLSEMVQMNTWNQHGYALLCIFRQGLALTVAVNIFALPSLLYFFHQFPLLSLLYNFFFPFLVSISMLLLILSAFVPWLHSVNNIYTSWVLRLTHEMPTSLDVTLRVDDFPLWALTTFLTFAFLASIYMRKRNDSEFSFL